MQKLLFKECQIYKIKDIPIDNSNILNLDTIIDLAIEEDLHLGDITTESLNLNSENVSCKIISKDKGILSGNEVACRVFQKIDKSIEYTEQTKDSETLNNGTVIANIFGDKNSILTAERTALNFLQRMSGVASITNEYVKLVKNISIFDTRKTIPGWRTLDKYAVKCGGGSNHRMNLGDGLLIKDNHISAANKQGISIKKLVEKSRNNSPKNLKIEIEVDSLDLLKEVVETNVDIIMLDNMTDKMIQKSIDITRGRKIIEVSGNVDKERLVELDNIMGIDIVSIGRITHSAKALDISLVIQS